LLKGEVNITSGEVYVVYRKNINIKPVIRPFVDYSVEKNLI